MPVRYFRSNHWIDPGRINICGRSCIRGSVDQRAGAAHSDERFGQGAVHPEMIRRAGPVPRLTVQPNVGLALRIFRRSEFSTEGDHCRHIMRCACRGCPRTCPRWAALRFCPKARRENRVYAFRKSRQHTTVACRFLVELCSIRIRMEE